MKTKDFDYYLPEELVAQTPLEKRDESRLMCLDKVTGELAPPFLRAAGLFEPRRLPDPE